MTPPKKSKPDGVTGRTAWDLIADNKYTVIALIFILLAIAIILVLTGLLKVNDGKLIIGYNASKTTLTSDNNLSNTAKIGNEQNRNFIIEEAFLNIQIEKTDTGLIKYYKTVYRIRALKDFDTTFTEQYSTTTGILQHVIGTEKEEVLHGDTTNKYLIPLNMKQNEVKTIMTGCNIISKIQPGDNGDFSSGIASNQEFAYYPNESDLISSITIHVESNSLNIHSFPKNAIRQTADGKTVVGQSTDSSQNPFISETPNRSLTFSWENIKPRETVGVIFYR